MTQTKKISLSESRKMLEDQKKVLLGVSSSQPVFEKELMKAKNWLLLQHFYELLDWVVQTFDKQFSNLRDRLKELFSDVPLALAN